MSTLLLIHSDTTDGSTTFTDSSNNSVINPVGVITHSAIQAKFGATSIKSGNSGAYLSIPDSDDLDFGNSDFTIDGWFWKSDTSTGTLFCKRGTSALGTGVLLGTSGSNVVASASSNGSSWDIFPLNTVIAPFTTSTWTHVALVRHGEVFTGYVNGVGTVLATSANPIAPNSYNVLIGGDSNTYYFYGYLDEVRVTNSAEWTSNFTPPAAPYVTYTVSGIITDEFQVPCSRTVRLYDRATGLFLGQTVSDSVTGVYNFAESSNSEVQRIVLDDASGTLYNDLIKRVIPG